MNESSDDTEDDNAERETLASMTFNGSDSLTFSNLHVSPAAHNRFDLGTASLAWRNVYGNASTASKLQTARTITLSGSVTGSATFDGSGNITINTTGGGSEGTWWGQPMVDGRVHGSMTSVGYIAPGIPGYYNVGSASYPFNDMYSNAFIGNSFGVSASIHPASPNSASVGSSDYPFKEAHILTVYNTSDATLKDIYGKIEQVDLKNIHAYRYSFKEDNEKHIGVLAQELINEYPELVKGEEGNYSVNYNGLIAILLVKIKELEEKLLIYLLLFFTFLL
ncbi:MAG: tail fiber domain-containing protein [Tannerellaceae bacterium]|nr:tail fiber domain-containing protein [Tannerellaceae bacterium]